MKNLILTISILLIASVSFAAESPNLFECKTNDGLVSISYSTSSFAGTPSFNYTNRLGGKEIVVNLFDENDIELQRTVMGTLVTVATEIIMDGPSTYISFTLPQVNITYDKADTRKFKTMAAKTIVNNTFGGPELVEGAVEQSEYFEMNCIADSVIF
jgi:hypothetical protein